MNHEKFHGNRSARFFEKSGRQTHRQTDAATLCIWMSAVWLTCTACGGSLTAEHGQFTSPRYPDSYVANVECVWNISVSPGNRLRLAFR